MYTIAIAHTWTLFHHPPDKGKFRWCSFQSYFLLNSNLQKRSKKCNRCSFWAIISSQAVAVPLINYILFSISFATKWKSLIVIIVIIWHLILYLNFKWYCRQNLFLFFLCVISLVKTTLSLLFLSTFSNACSLGMSRAFWIAAFYMWKVLLFDVSSIITFSSLHQNKHHW